MQNFCFGGMSFFGMLSCGCTGERNSVLGVDSLRRHYVHNGASTTSLPRGFRMLQTRRREKMLHREIHVLHNDNWILHRRKFGIPKKDLCPLRTRRRHLLPHLCHQRERNNGPDQHASGANGSQQVMFGALDELFEKTSLKPKDIGILVVNCSLFNPTPSLASMIINHYKMRGNIKSVNLGGMGCSAGLISIDLARDLLQVIPNH